ncbi:MAG: acyl-CoA thioesterase [Halobacteriovoraceae bacterium]|jgi:acyl-CoA hydrolase|nr:acyl-CoA thioesterase [Halobacteriovoraceae bacterium]MBT5093569.1 acyl-CoA thioesterase [Halobacteriovoraceae bacterium]
MVKTNSIEYSRVSTRHIVMPNHANPNGYIFGGFILGWIDLAAAMVAEKHSGMDVATVKVSEVHFKYPVKIGEHVQIEAVLESVGTTSMVIVVEVYAEGQAIENRIHATSASLTLVGMGKNGKPTAVPALKKI